MENNSPSMATQNSTDISTANVQQHFSVPSSGSQAVSIVAQDPSKNVFIVDTQQHAALQMFGDPQQRLIAASASSNQVELSNNSNTPASPQTIVV